MQDTVFRTYDIRGRVGTELIIDDVYEVTRAIAYYVKSKNPHVQTVAVGMDGRTHSPALKEQVVKGLQDSGLDVLFVGVVPSPVLYFATFNADVQAGIMITASHNPGSDNGLKIKLGHETVWGDKLQEIKQLWRQGKHCDAQRTGSYREQDMISAYVAWMAEHFAHLKGMSLPALVDCGNGAAGTVMPELIRAMGWQNVQLLFAEVDGAFPHHEADPIVLKNMKVLQQEVMRSGAVGIGFDGDVDRMAPIAHTGELVAGDKLLAVLSKKIIQDNPGAAVVYDIKASGGLAELITLWGGKAVMAPTGHSNVRDQMKAHKALVAGELSCHFFFEDRYFGYDDGIYAMMRLFEILHETKATLADLIADFPCKCSSPEFRIVCAEADKKAIVHAVTKAFEKRSDVAITTIDGVRMQMPYGWGLVRQSNTQPMMSIRFEANSPAELVHIKEEFVAAMQDYFDGAWLREQFSHEA